MSPDLQFSDNGQIWVWQLPSQEFCLQYLQPTVQFDGFSVMVWGDIWTAGHSEFVVCNRNVNAKKYISILNPRVVACIS